MTDLVRKFHVINYWK